MATKKPAKPEPSGDSANQQARALVDLPEYGAQSGGLFEAPAGVVAELAAAGKADSHPDAVAYAKAAQ